VIVKSAFDWKLGAHALHFETAGLLRTFKVFNNLVTPNVTNTLTEGSGSVNLNFEVLRNFHLIANTFYGAGNGRYIGALGPARTSSATSTFWLPARPLHRSAMAPPASPVWALVSRVPPTQTTSHFRKGPSGLPRRSWGARTTGSCNS
jgi:hypothetical protein